MAKGFNFVEREACCDRSVCCASSKGVARIFIGVWDCCIGEGIPNSDIKPLLIEGTALP